MIVLSREASGNLRMKVRGLSYGSPVNSLVSFSLRIASSASLQAPSTQTESRATFRSSEKLSTLV